MFLTLTVTVAPFSHPVDSRLLEYHLLQLEHDVPCLLDLQGNDSLYESLYEADFFRSSM